MDTHSCRHSVQQDTASDGAGPVPEPLPALAGVCYQGGACGKPRYFHLASPSATEALGQLLGRLAQDGDVFCLSGDLGAGKTLCCKGIAQALGVPGEDVVSPTFSLMNVYNGDCLEVRHFDLYRLDSPEELTDIGFYEYAGGEGVTLIEWAELFTSELPPEYLQISLTVLAGARQAELFPVGPRYEKLCEDVVRYVDAGAGYGH